MATATPDMVGDRIERAFDAFDADRDGYMEWSDYEAVVDRCLAASDISADDRRAHALRAFYAMYWQELLRHANASTNRLAKDEFLAANRAVSVDTSRINVVEGSGHAVFDVIDVDGDNEIDKGEFVRFLKEVLQAEIADAMAAFDQIDSDGNGSITRAEFMRALREYSYSNDPHAAGGAVFGRL